LALDSSTSAFKSSSAPNPLETQSIGGKNKEYNTNGFNSKQEIVFLGMRRAQGHLPVMYSEYPPRDPEPRKAWFDNNDRNVLPSMLLGKE
jgi:hypothetical protein